MSENSTQDRTEKATPKRQRDARKRGQVARSRELSTAAVVALAVLVLSKSGHSMAQSGAELMRASMQFDAGLIADPKRIVLLFGERLLQGFQAAAPVLGATLVAALFAPALLGGWNFSGEALKPDFSRINPLKGLGRMFSSKGLVELGKSLLKFGLIAAIGASYVWLHRSEFGALARRDVAEASGEAVGLALSMLSWMCGALLLIAAVDAPYQLWSYLKQLRMTKQEVRDEMKESEGRPEVKAKIRRLQAEMSRRRMMEAVPQADVVVTNPTHYAVALKYTVGKMRAPKVVAKGAGEIAATIRELAKQHRVPLVSAPPLARALYRGVNIEREIPPQLYAAVAKVLTYVYQLKQWRGGTPMPQLAELGDIKGGEPDPQS